MNDTTADEKTIFGGFSEKVGVPDKQTERELRKLALPKTKKLGRNDGYGCPCGSGKKFKNCCYLKEAPKPDGLSPAEAVFGMMIWLTQRQEPMTLGTRHDASKAAMAATVFCEVNELGKPATMENLRFPCETIPEAPEKLGASDVDGPLTGYLTRLEDLATAVIGAADKAALDQWKFGPDLIRLLKEYAKAALENRDPVEVPETTEPVAT